jgi:hypothetical protein
MASVLSVDDLFTVGVAFDLMGGYFLGRGLVANVPEIVRRTQTYWGSNAVERVTQLQARADGLIGLSLLGVGFALQAGGYLALIGGAGFTTGAGRALVATALMLGTALVALPVCRRLHGKITRRFVRDAARVMPASGTLQDYPDGRALVEMGQHLGLSLDSAEPAAIAAFAKRHFGVERVSWSMPPEATRPRQ